MEEEKRVIGVTTKVDNIKKEDEEIQTISAANKNSKGVTKVSYSYTTYLNYCLFKLNYLRNAQ